MSIEKEQFNALTPERQEEIEAGALPSVLEAAEIRWTRQSVKEIEADIATDAEINEELRGAEIPGKPRQIREVREARQEMVRKEAEYDRYKILTGQVSKIFKKEERVKIKEEYEQAKDRYNEEQNKLLKFYLEKAQVRWAGEEGKAKFEEFRNEVIFRRAFGREQERISQAKQEALSSQDQARFKNILMRMGQEFSKIPKGRRWVYTALLGTGAALGVGAIAAPAALGYAGFRFKRAALASFSAAGIKRIGDKLEKLWLKKHGRGEREEIIRESFLGQIESINNFEQMSNLLVEKREERDKELAKLAKAQKYWRVGKIAAMVGAGSGIAFCAGHFDIFGGPKLAEEAGSIAGKPEAEVFQIAEKVSIKRGDSIWSVAEKYLKGNKVYQQLVEVSDKDTAEALETYNIDRVKDTIAAHPQAYGLLAEVDVDKLTAAQLKGINWEKSFADTFPEGKGLTTGLAQEQIDSIVKDKGALRTFFQEHPQAPRTSENYEAILKGKGITGEPVETSESAEVEKAPEKLEPLTEGQLSKARLNLIDAYGMTPGESKAIFDEKISNLLNNAPEKWQEAVDKFGPDTKLKHDGFFSTGEYKKYWQLANDVRAVGPNPEEMDMTVGEFLGRKLEAGVE